MEELGLGVTPTPIVALASPHANSIPAALTGKVASDLWDAVRQIESDVNSGALQFTAGATAPANINLPNIADAHVNQAGAIHVYARMNNFEEPALAAIESLGLTIRSVSQQVGVVDLWTPYERIDELAMLPAVERVELPIYGVVNAGLVDSAGDAIHNAHDVRNGFTAAMTNIDGSGIKVGVISDGVQNRSQVQGGATPDLPGVTVNPLLPGSGNEGTAMLEIIHDLAPGAQLFFSSGIAGTVAMVDSINWLVGQGVDIIVDDLSFFGEHFFSDGSVAQATASAIGSGVTYLTSAGNHAERHYQGQWSATNGVHDFDATAGIDNFLDIGNIPAGGIIDVFLQWSDAWNASSNNYNFGLWNFATSSYVATSVDPQTGTQAPLEALRWTNNTGTAVNLGLVIDDSGSPASRELETFVLPRNFVMNSLVDNDRTQLDSIFGQAAVEAAMAIGAINAGDPFNDTVATYSSQGNSTIYTNFATQSKTQRQSLDGSGIDGVETRIGQLGFFSNPFFGTSAAAPHAAAIAALLLDINPLSPAQVASFLNLTAVDIAAPGYDSVSGSGRFDALAAAEAVATASGDYNHDGVVDRADFDVWRSTLGNTVTRGYLGADGNGDGLINPADYVV